MCECTSTMIKLLRVNLILSSAVIVCAHADTRTRKCKHILEKKLLQAHCQQLVSPAEASSSPGVPCDTSEKSGFSGESFSFLIFSLHKSASVVILQAALLNSVYQNFEMRPLSSQKIAENLVISFNSTISCISTTHVHFGLKKSAFAFLLQEETGWKSSPVFFFCAGRIEELVHAKPSVWANHCTLHRFAFWALARPLVDN